MARIALFSTGITLLGMLPIGFSFVMAIHLTRVALRHTGEEERKASHKKLRPNMKET